MKQPPIKTKELSGSTVQIADGQNWEIASITAYGENAQGGTTEAPVALTGVDSVQVCGNNLLPMATETKTIYGVTFTPNSNGSITVSGTATGGIATYNFADGLDRAMLDQTVFVSGAIQLVKVIINEKTAEGAFARNVIVDRGQGASGILTKQKDSNILYATLQVQNGDTVNHTIYPMLNLGSTAMPYEPYQGSVTTLPIPRPLRKVGDVRDVCRTRVKSVYDKRIVLDGTENWNISSSKPNSFLTPVSERIVNGLSDSYPTLKSPEIGTKNGIYLNYTADIIVTDLACSTVEEFKAHLSAHPITVYYRSTAYDGTNGLDVCLTEYQTGFVELDGTEKWVQGTGSNAGYLEAQVLKNTNESHLAVSSIAPFKYQFSGNCVFVTNNKVTFGSALGSAYTVDTWKAYLAAQKAAGTPVQVAYHLATPEVYATDPVDFDNTAGPLTVMTGGEVKVTLTHRMLTPYTAWTIQYDSEGEYTGDFFNVEDYDRIKQNIEYLREYAYFLYGGFTMRGMVAVTVESYGYASTIDALDANLEAIAANTFRPPDMMPVKQWRGNQPPPGSDDWNRIENTCLLLFEQFERQFACLPKLAFELKGSAF